MSNTESKPKWKRGLSLALKIYAGLCTLLVTVYLGLAIWGNSSGGPPPGAEELSLTASYGRYMASEYPQRGDYFVSLAGTLGMRASAVPVTRADVLKYLGKPDLVQGSMDTGTLLYLYHPSGRTNQWEAYVWLTDGKLKQVGFNEAGVNDRSGFQPFSGGAAPNPQGGANGRQPFSSETNRTSAAAASRRSP
jgi:hypothetical protein